jgi:hypothetical protein
MSAFGEVDADLMGAPGLEPNLAETRALEPSQNANVSDGELPLVAPSRGGTAESIAPISHQAALDGSVFDPSVGETEIDARDLSLAELHLERPLGGAGTGVDQESRGVLVEAVDDVEHPRRWWKTALPPLVANGIHERLPFPFFVRDARYPRRFLSDHEMVVLVDDARRGKRPRSTTFLPNPNRLPGRDPGRWIGGGAAIDRDTTVVDQPPRRGPGQLWGVPSQDRGERQTRLGRRYVERVLRTRTRSRPAA